MPSTYTKNGSVVVSDPSGIQNKIYVGFGSRPLRIRWRRRKTIDRPLRIRLRIRLRILYVYIYLYVGCTVTYTPLTLALTYTFTYTFMCTFTGPLRIRFRIRYVYRPLCTRLRIHYVYVERSGNFIEKLRPIYRPLRISRRIRFYTKKRTPYVYVYVYVGCTKNSGKFLDLRIRRCIRYVYVNVEVNVYVGRRSEFCQRRRPFPNSPP